MAYDGGLAFSGRFRWRKDLALEEIDLLMVKALSYLSLRREVVKPQHLTGEFGLSTEPNCFKPIRVRLILISQESLLYWPTTIAFLSIFH